MMNQNTNQTAEINVTHLTLRRYLGILGILLPFTLVIGNGFKVEESISHYYYTSMIVPFTGILIAFGLFLFSYRGYEKGKKDVISDNLYTNAAGIFAMITALIPTACEVCDSVPNGHHDSVLNVIHLVCATLFFVIMGWIAYDRFPRGETKDQNKLRRKPIYKICGVMIWLALIAMGLGFALDLSITGFDVFIGETIALIFFGIAWLLKGEALEKIGL